MLSDGGFHVLSVDYRGMCYKGKEGKIGTTVTDQKKLHHKKTKNSVQRFFKKQEAFDDSFCRL